MNIRNISLMLFLSSVLISSSSAMDNRREVYDIKNGAFLSIAMTVKGQQVSYRAIRSKDNCLEASCFGCSPHFQYSSNKHSFRHTPKETYFYLEVIFLRAKRDYFGS